MDFKEIYKHTETKKIVDRVKKVYKHFTEPQEKTGKPKGKKYGETDLLSGSDYFPPKP
jgi:hypothetical protein